MLRVERRATQGTASDVLSLPYDQRKRSRLRACTQRGVEVALVLPRGSLLRDGDLLAADSGEILVVRAAEESVSDALAGDPALLARAAYHLGNRHVALQVEAGRLRYLHDHVLDAMVKELGLEVVVGVGAFEPEAGAYAGGHGHGHGHGHDNDEHEHPHPHGRRG